MCGITGSHPLTSAEAVQGMVEQIKHRGPDGHGVVDLAASSLGHTRLAILDVAGGQQPMNYNQHWLSFNGEIYNHQALRHRYLRGHTLHTRTDTEVILHLYTRLGPACVELLDGMFALALVSRDELLLARDPLGIKPLYMGARAGMLYFASEIKALTQVTDDIQEFPAGHWYHSKLGWKSYYRLDKPVDCRVRSEAEALPLIRQTLAQAVHKRLMADVPLGVSLSGGLDSSIVSLLACEGLAQLNSFAVGVEGSDDLPAARQMARFLGTRHHEYVYTEQDIQAVLPEVIYSLESFDPALVRSAIPNYFLARLAAEHVKVFLTGEGADELYAGYTYLGAFDEPKALQSELIYIIAALHNTNLQRADRMSMAHSLEARVPFLDTQSVALALSLPPTWKLQRPDRPEKALLRRAFAAELPPEIVNRPKQKFSQGAGSAHIIAQRAEETISDTEFVAESLRLADDWNYRLPNKEALYYYKILRQFYRDEWILPEMGLSRSI